MSFDTSIENIILELNETKKIDNILHIGACLGEEITFYQRLNPKKIYWRLSIASNFINQIIMQIIVCDYIIIYSCLKSI